MIAICHNSNIDTFPFDQLLKNDLLVVTPHGAGEVRTWKTMYGPDGIRENNAYSVTRYRATISAIVSGIRLGCI